MHKETLEKFKSDNKVTTKGSLSVVLVLTRNAKDLDFPLYDEMFMTNKQGQVKGLGKAAVQNILKDYGISKVLAEEGGRTSRGSIGLMKKYISFINQNFKKSDLDSIESWWVEQIRIFFRGKPF